MDCPTCGAALLSSAHECAPCAAKAAKALEPPKPWSEAPADSPRRPFAQITPYSGPYPPPYVQISSSERQPGPVNILSKWIGLVWSGVILICILLGYSSAKTDHLGDTGNVNWANISLPVWCVLWAVIVVPAFFIYRATRPQS